MSGEKTRMSIKAMLFGFTSIVTAIAVALPADVLSRNAVLAKFASVMCDVFPGIKTFAEHSPHPEVVTFVLALLWAALPALVWLNATRVHAFENWRPPYVSSPLRAVPILAGGVLILLAGAASMGFSDSQMIHSAKGRANLLADGLTQSRIGLGLTSSLAFLAITWIFLALVRASYLTVCNRDNLE